MKPVPRTGSVWTFQQLAPDIRATVKCHVAAEIRDHGGGNAEHPVEHEESDGGNEQGRRPSH